jgi:hypothetical protein
MKPQSRFKEFKEFKFKKQSLENESKRLLGFYEFNKCALISEFSLKDYYAFLEKNNTFLTKHYEDYSKLLATINVVEKINNVISFDESKILFGSKNFLPKNVSTIYQPVDRTSEIIAYDSDSEQFRKINIIPKKLRGFSFFPFCRYLNFNGRLFVSGGYQDTKLSKVLWAFEDRTTLNFEGGANNDNTNGKYSNLSNINNEFYSNINKQNYAYEDENFPNLCLLRCADMIYARAGHTMVGLAPSLIYVFGGTESLKSCEMYHFDSNRWEEIALLNESRIDASAFIYKNYIYVFFGLRYDKISKKYNFIDTIERISLMNTQISEWEYVIPKFSDSRVQDMLARSLCGLALKNNSSSAIYICGGQVAKEKFSTDVFDYDFELNTLVLSDKKLPKPCGFIEPNFIYLFKTGINFDIYGDVFYYQATDNFNFQFQRF